MTAPPKSGAVFVLSAIFRGMTSRKPAKIIVLLMQVRFGIRD